MKNSFNYYLGDTKSFVIRLKAGGQPYSLAGKTILAIISSDRVANVVHRFTVTEHTDEVGGVTQFTIDPTVTLEAGQYWLTVILRDGDADLTFIIVSLHVLERVPADE